MNRRARSGALSTAKALFLTLIATSFFFLFALSSALRNWASAGSLGALHDTLRIALWAVIIGVVVEEWHLIGLVSLFLEHVAAGRRRYAVERAKAHKDELAKGLGFAILMLGLSGEMVLDPGIEAAQNAIEADADARLDAQRRIAIKAQEDAREAIKKESDLLAENVELEHALAPRDLDLVNVAMKLSSLPRVPIFVSALGKEEPMGIAGHIINELPAIKVGATKQWIVVPTSPVAWMPEGITVRYAEPPNLIIGSDAEKVAIGLCDAIKGQGYDVSAEFAPAFLPADSLRAWPNQVPKDAVLVMVGQKPNHFWENKSLLQKGLAPFLFTSACTPDEWFKQMQENRITERGWPGNGARPKR